MRVEPRGRSSGLGYAAWAAFNGVTEWIDHRRTRQSAYQSLSSIWFGDAYRTKARAFLLAQDKMAAWMN